ncbi:MAG: hypothetical protein Fur0037_26080 [Planctomycetota bacterium]
MQVGRPFTVRFVNLPAHSAGLLVAGWHRDRWLGRPLPLSLDPLGMTGCSLHVRPESLFWFPTGSGAGRWDLAAPAMPALSGARLKSQMLFAQRNANPLGIGSTNALELVIGAGTRNLSRIDRHGITWTFDREYPVGRFCNGDWWVVGPVAIVSISPATAVSNGRTVNGSMVNPTPGQENGYDSQLAGYSDSRNAARGVAPSNPLVLQPGTSLISAISQLDPLPNSVARLRTAAVLTVVGAEPPADAFRPPYAGTDKAVRFREAQLDYGVLARLAPASGAPSMAAAAALFERVWLDHVPDWQSRYLHPVENMRDYGRDLAADTGTGALMLNCDFPDAEKRDLFVRMVQLGIDEFGNLVNGCHWVGDGGHGSGRKFPILLAGRALGDAAMLAVGQNYDSYYSGPQGPNPSYFGEDSQTFYVTETSPGVFDWGYGNYRAADRGLPEWGIRHSYRPELDSSDWNNPAYRTCCTANAWIGYCLAARVMGLQQAWNHPAWFDYMDRFAAREPSGWTRAWKPWHGAMWDAYRGQF